MKSVMKKEMSYLFAPPTDANAYSEYYGIVAFFVFSKTSNLPTASDGIIVQMRVRGDALVQVFFTGWQNPSIMYFRTKWGNSWRKWARVTTTTVET